MILWRHGEVIKKIHHRKRVEGPYLQQFWVGFNKNEPKDFQQLWQNKNELGNHGHAPALRVGNPIPKHKATHPQYKPDDGKFPEIYNGYGKELESAYEFENRPFWPVLQKLKSGSLILDKGLFDEQ